jgi:hypothetical protein
MKCSHLWAFHFPKCLTLVFPHDIQWVPTRHPLGTTRHFLLKKLKSSIFTPCKTYHLMHYPAHIALMCKFVEVIVPNDDVIHLVWWYTRVVLSLNITQLSFEVWNLMGRIINTCNVLFHQHLYHFDIV